MEGGDPQPYGFVGYQLSQLDKVGDLTLIFVPEPAPDEIMTLMIRSMSTDERYSNRTLRRIGLRRSALVGPWTFSFSYGHGLRAMMGGAPPEQS
jgi:hypothetical protein